MTSPASARVYTPQVLIAFGLVLLLVAGLSWSRDGALRDSADAAAQDSYVTHDISVVADYRGPYVGDNSNTVQLLYALPLGSRVERVEIHGTDVVVVLDDSQVTQAVRENVLYSAVAFLSAIDNASSVSYHDLDATYTVMRSDVEARFGAPLSDLLDSEAEWSSVRTLVPIESSSLVF